MVLSQSAILLGIAGFTFGVVEMNVSAQSLYRVPVAGWLVRDAVKGHPDAKYYFIANFVCIFGLLVYEFGYAFLICYALTGTALALGGLVFLTASDMLRAGPAKRHQPRGAQRMARNPARQAQHG